MSDGDFFLMGGSNPPDPNSPPENPPGDGGAGGGGGFVTDKSNVLGALASVCQGDIPLVMQSAGVPVCGPAYPILDGYVVEVAPLSTNTQPCYVSTTGPDAAKLSGPRSIFAATGVPRTLNVRNLADVWMYSTVLGEGVTLTVKHP